MNLWKKWIILILMVIVIALIVNPDISQIFHDKSNEDTLVVKGPVDESNMTYVINFSDMTDNQKSVFKDALQARDGRSRIPQEVDDVIWIENDAVIYYNKTYEVYVSAD